MVCTYKSVFGNGLSILIFYSVTLWASFKYTDKWGQREKGRKNRREGNKFELYKISKCFTKS